MFSMRFSNFLETLVGKTSLKQHSIVQNLFLDSCWHYFSGYSYIFDNFLVIYHSNETVVHRK